MAKPIILLMLEKNVYWVYESELNKSQLNKIQKIVEKHKNEIIKEWKNYFSKR